MVFYKATCHNYLQNCLVKFIKKNQKVVRDFLHHLCTDFSMKKMPPVFMSQFLDNFILQTGQIRLLLLAGDLNFCSRNEAKTGLWLYQQFNPKHPDPHTNGAQFFSTWHKELKSTKIVNHVGRGENLGWGVSFTCFRFSHLTKQCRKWFSAVVVRCRLY